MNTSVFKTSVEFQARLPFSVTNTANIIAAIANRNDTPNRLTSSIAGWASRNCVIPLSNQTAAAIFGQKVAFEYFDAMANPATREFFRKLEEKLYSVGIALMRGTHLWSIAKFQRDARGAIDTGFEYVLADLVKQSPNGLVLALTPESDGQPSEHSIKSGTQYVTVSLATDRRLASVKNNS